MGKQGKQSKQDGAKGGNRRRSRGQRRALWGALAVLAVVALLAYANLGDGKQGRSFHVQGGETHAVLDPTAFGPAGTQAAYAAAAAFPEVMDQMYCYCYCDKAPFKHKSLLSCFTNSHGAG